MLLSHAELKSAHQQKPAQEAGAQVVSAVRWNNQSWQLGCRLKPILDSVNAFYNRNMQTQAITAYTTSCTCSRECYPPSIMPACVNELVAASTGCGYGFSKSASNSSSSSVLSSAMSCRNSSKGTWGTWYTWGTPHSDFQLAF